MTTNLDPRSLPSETPIWLHVRSVTQSGPGTNMPIPPPGLIGQTQSSRCLDELPECSPEQKSIEKSAKRKFKSVRFDDLLKKDGDGRSLRKKESPAADKPNGEKELSFAMCDLKATKSVCCHLQRSCGPESTCKDSCIGYLEYLEAACSFRLIFYDASKNAVAQKKQHRTPRKALPVNGLLSGLQTLHQLTLAHTLAMTILQYHSTSWLPLDWGLKDLSYFSETGQSPEDDISKTLQSLHLSTQFPTQAHASAFQSANDVNDLNYLYGIRNLTLAKLGVALIEIGRQKEIGSLGSNSTSHEVIISARKILLEGPSSLATLGPRYFKIAQKCIQCDFSCGDNLEGDDLRSAVYSEVVCGLESMIKDWKRFLDIK